MDSHTGSPCQSITGLDVICSTTFTASKSNMKYLYVHITHITYSIYKCIYIYVYICTHMHIFCIYIYIFKYIYVYLIVRTAEFNLILVQFLSFTSQLAHCVMHCGMAPNRKQTIKRLKARSQISGQTGKYPEKSPNSSGSLKETINKSITSNT